MYCNSVARYLGKEVNRPAEAGMKCVKVRYPSTLPITSFSGHMRLVVLCVTNKKAGDNFFRLLEILEVLE